MHGVSSHLISTKYESAQFSLISALTINLQVEPSQASNYEQQQQLVWTKAQNWKNESSQINVAFVFPSFSILNSIALQYPFISL